MVKVRPRILAVVALFLVGVPSSAFADLLSFVIPVDPGYSQIDYFALKSAGNQFPTASSAYHNPFLNPETVVTFPSATETLYTYQSLSGATINPADIGFELPFGLDTGSPFAPIRALDLTYSGTKNGQLEFVTHVPVFSIDFVNPAHRGSGGKDIVVRVNAQPLEFLILSTFAGLGQVVGVEMFPGALGALLEDAASEVLAFGDGANFLDPLNPPNADFTDIPVPNAPLTLGPGETFRFTVVPEPSSLTLALAVLGSGMAVWGGRRWSHRRSRATRA